MPKRIAIGCGSAYANDRVEPALALAESGQVDYMAFDCLAERTLALAQIRRLEDPSTGQDERLPRLVRELSPYLGRGGVVVGNFGAANPTAGLKDVVDGLRACGVRGTRVGAIWGDDVRQQVLDNDLELPEMGCRTRDVREKLVSANAYIGAEPIVELLDRGAKFVLGGRLADPSLYVGPICYELGWPLNDWDLVAQATLVAHLLECGVHVTGGNFADPPYRLVDDLVDLAYPLAVVSDTEARITKLPGTGGLVNAATAKAQIGYEIHDPAAYLTPDVTADFRNVWVESVTDAVCVGGAVGQQRPDSYKVLVGLDLGWKVVAEISFGGPGCVERAQLGEQVVRRHLEPFGDLIDELRFDLHGMTALFQDQLPSSQPAEVRLRVAARCLTKNVADRVAYETEYLYFGPAGGGGVTSTVVPAIGVTPAFLLRDLLNVETEVVEV